MNLSNACDTTNYDVLLAKRNAYDFNKNALKIIHNYLNNKYQSSKINNVYSSWGEILLKVSQRDDRLHH